MQLYILGAGFSGDAGIPTMKNFMHAVRRTAEDFADSSFHSVLINADRYAQKQGCDNIETLLRLSLNDPVFTDLVRAFCLTISSCSQSFLHLCRKGSSIGWYEDFARKAVSEKAAIVTFNYDLVIEQILWYRLHISEDYCLPFNHIDRPITNTHHASRIPLLKLHGSVSWLSCLSCRAIVNAHEYILFPSFSHLTCPKCGGQLIPFIIPPTFRKAVDMAGPLLALWKKADQLFLKAHRIIIGGLSFAERDADFRERFLKCVGSSRNIQEIVIVNRNAETCRTLCKWLPARISTRIVHEFRQFAKENG